MSAGARAAPYWLASPATLVMLALVALPLILTLSLSFYTFDPASGIKDTLTLANYREVLTDDYYYGIFLRTFWLALLVTLLSVLIGVPEAYVLLRMSERWRAVFMVVVLGPLLVSVVVRTLGWAVLLGSEGIINNALRALGLIDEPLRMMFTFGGVLVALTHVLAPFMVLAVWTSLQKLDPATEQAAESLGASTGHGDVPDRLPAGDAGHPVGLDDRLRAGGERVCHAGDHRRAAAQGRADRRLRRVPERAQLAARAPPSPCCC